MYVGNVFFRVLFLNRNVIIYVLLKNGFIQIPKKKKIPTHHAFFIVQLWDLRKKGCIYTYKGHSKSINSIRFSPDGQWIASGGEDGVVRVS